jgi:ABC-2 type transport system ATP-binding protein
MNNHRPALETHELTKQYGSFTALDRLSMQIDRGQILGLIGPNGAGKTTTIRILVGQARPTSGTALINGVDCTQQAGLLKRLVGYMPDVFGSYDNMRVHEYLDFFAAAFEIPRRERITRLGEVMELTSVTPLKDLFVESLSHGMKQRVALARTLLHKPELVILDEPANGLDPKARIDMRLLLRRLAEGGCSLLVTSHILPELSRICDQVAILVGGRLRAFGRLSDVTKKLQQRQLFEIELGGAEGLESACQMITEKFPVIREASISADERTIRFYTTQPNFELSDVLMSMVKSGFRVAQCREVPMDLEDAFLTISQSVAEREVAPHSAMPVH